MTYYLIKVKPYKRSIVQSDKSNYPKLLFDLFSSGVVPTPGNKEEGGAPNKTQSQGSIDADTE